MARETTHRKTGLNLTRLALLGVFIALSTPASANEFPTGKGLERLCQERDTRNNERRAGAWKEYNQRKNETVCIIRTSNSFTKATFGEIEYIHDQGERHLCKNRIKIFFTLSKLIADCSDNQKRTIIATPKENGSCTVANRETGQSVIVPQKDIVTFREYIENISIANTIAFAIGAPPSAKILRTELKRCLAK